MLPMSPTPIACEKVMDGVTILIARGGETVELRANSLAQARDRIAAAWTSLFPAGPEREVAALEVIATLVVEGLE